MSDDKDPVRTGRRKLEFGINEDALRINALKNAGLIPPDPGFERLRRIGRAIAENDSVITPRKKE